MTNNQKEILLKNSQWLINSILEFNANIATGDSKCILYSYMDGIKNGVASLEKSLNDALNKS